MRRLIVFTAFLGAASPALAECPVAEDLSRGIALTFADELTEVYRAGEESRVIVEGLDQGIMTHRLSLLHGAYLERYVAVFEGEEQPESASVYTYPQGEAAPATPVVDGQWSGLVTLSEGGTDRDEKQAHSYGIPVEAVIGDCTLLAVPITITYGDDGEYVEIVHYFPDLNFGYLHSFSNNGGEFLQQLVISIEAIE